MGKPEGKRPLGRQMRRRGDNITMDIRNWDVGYGLDLSGSGQGQVVGTYGCCNEPSSSIKCGEFLDQLKTGQLLKDSAPWSK